MSKKVFHILLLYLAYGIVLAHNLVPHHHHAEKETEGIGLLVSHEQHEDHSHGNALLQFFKSFELYPHSGSEDTSLNHSSVSKFAKIFPVTVPVVSLSDRQLPVSEIQITAWPPGLEITFYLSPLAASAGLRGPPVLVS